MKNIKKFLVAIILVLFVFVLASCNSSNRYASDSSYYYEDDQEILYNSEGRKVVYYVDYNFNTKEPKSLVIDVRNKIISYNGYISFSNQSNYYTYYEFKVETEFINEIVEYLDSLNDITNKYITTKDITSSYNSNDAKIKRLEEKKKIYEDELENNSDLTTSEKLSYLKLIEDIDKELEEYYDKLDQMDIETKYSTIRLRFYQNNDVGFMQVFGNTVLGSLSFVGISLLIVSPFLLCGLIVYIVLRKKNKKEIKE